jgi:hypothetical protein
MQYRYKFAICAYLASPTAEIGVTNRSIEDLDSNLQFFRRVHKNLLHDKGFSRTMCHGGYIA